MVGSLTKTCSKCKQTKSVSLFNAHPHAAGRRRPECADCTQKYHRSHRSAKPKGWDRKYALKKYFGMTMEQYSELLEKQDGTCAICKKPQVNRSMGFLTVDHCHDKKNVRGLLCSTCNSGLGFFKDSPALLAAAIQYLTTSKEAQ